MSSDQQEITEYAVDDATDSNDAVVNWASNVDQQTQNHCTNCGSHISADYARLHEDADGDVHRCPQCATQREIFEGRATDPDRDVTPGKGGNNILGSQL